MFTRVFPLVALGFCLGLGSPSVAAADTDEERKAIEEIERRAEAEKKKALERIRKKAEAEAKKAEAEAKRAEARAKKAEAEANRAAEAKRKRDEERLKKEGKPTPPPEPTPAPEAPPPAAPEPPPATVAPPTPPPPIEPLPEATPVAEAGDARWTGIGFVRQGTPASDAASEDTAGIEVPDAFGALGMNRGHFLMGIGQASFNPINDGTTDDDTAFNMLDLKMRFGWEFRNLGSLFAPWFDVGPNLLFGSREEIDPMGNETGRTFSAFGMQFQGRFGMDLAVIQMFSGGPFVGYQVALYNAELSDDDCSSCSGEEGTTGGLRYGLHARFRTRANPGQAERLYVDGVLAWQGGEFQTTSHVELELGLRAGSIFFVGWYEKRLGSSGQIDRGEIGDIGELTAATMPIDQRLGGGIAATF